MVDESDIKRKKTLLLVAFGTSVSGANSVYEEFEDNLRRELPDIEIYWSFTSKSIREKLKERGKVVLSPVKAITKLLEQDNQKIVVQSLHIVPGAEYTGLVKTVSSFKHLPEKNKKICIGQPLLTDHPSMIAVAKALIKNLPVERNENDPVIFMGHGTSHEANVYYPALQFYLNQSSDNLLIATIEGYPLLRDILLQIKKSNSKNVWLIPLLAVAGYHAKVDMDGDSEGTWRTILENEGFEVKSILSGVLNNPMIQKLWIKRIGEMF